MTGFNFNEELKDRCMLLGASSCFTKFFAKDKKLKNTPYWVNVITLPKHMHKNLVTVMNGVVNDYLSELEYLGFDSSDIDVHLEDGSTAILYIILAGKKDFTELELL